MNFQRHYLYAKLYENLSTIILYQCVTASEHSILQVSIIRVNLRAFAFYYSTAICKTFLYASRQHDYLH